MAGSGTQQESYLRFTMTNLASPVQRAVLRMYVTTNGTGNGPAVYATGSGWTESGLTWSTRPARIGGVIANVGTVATNSWAEYDVTPLVTRQQYGQSRAGGRKHRRSGVCRAPDQHTGAARAHT